MEEWDLQENHNQCDYIFNHGIRILIELKDTTIFEGDYNSGTNDRIDVCNVLIYPKDPRNPTIHKEILSFYRMEIASIRQFRMPGNIQSKSSCPTISMTRDEFHCLLDTAMNYVYINQKDITYMNAVQHLKSREVVGVVGLGRRVYVANGLNYLVITSSSAVFIFDLYALAKNDIPIDIKELLENDSVEKVVYYSFLLQCCLRKIFKMEIKNVFDITIADVLIYKKKTGKIPQQGRSLSKCLASFYNFPLSLVENESLNLNWEEQPLGSFLKMKASLLGAYLIPLKNTLENIMLESYYNAVQLYLNSAK